MTLSDEVGSPTNTVPIPTTVANVNVSSRAALLRGWSFRETTGVAAASIDILDGNDPGGELLATINLSAGQSIRENAPGYGVLVEMGPFLRVNSGSVQGAMWIIDLAAAVATALANGA
jgi:hypothetical protein